MKATLLILILAVVLPVTSPVFARPDPNFHIFLCFGQSNMEGGGRIEERDKSVDPRFQVLADFDKPATNRKFGQWYDAIPPLTKRTRVISMMDYFGRTMVANLPERFRGGVVKLGVSGARIELRWFARVQARLGDATLVMDRHRVCVGDGALEVVDGDNPSARQCES